MSFKIRRIVAGLDVDGRSFVLSDSEPPVTVEVPDVVTVRDLWFTASAPAIVPVVSMPETPGRPTLEPPPGGTKFSIAEIPPLKVSQGAVTGSELFSAVDSEHVMDRSASRRHATMHTTDTIDYQLVLAGELTLILDKEEIAVGPGDLVVLGGVNHTWENRSEDAALLLAVLVGARRQ
jgi:mannose-6-phosphate isomerase-like protein (cupin superfamily)